MIFSINGIIQGLKLRLVAFIVAILANKMKYLKKVTCFRIIKDRTRKCKRDLFYGDSLLLPAMNTHTFVETLFKFS